MPIGNKLKNNAEAVKKKLSETQPDFAIRLKEQNEIIKEAEIKLRQWDNEKIESI